MVVHLFLNNNKALDFLPINSIKNGGITDATVRICNPIHLSPRVQLKPSVSIDKFTFINWDSVVYPNVYIGAYCSIGRGVQIGLANHPTQWLSSHTFQYNTGWFPNIDAYLQVKRTMPHMHHRQTKIGADVWIGNNAMIKSGVTIGHGAIIGAGAVVVKNIPPYAIVGGNPAKIIRYRFEEKIIRQLLILRWWELDLIKLKNINFSEIEQAIHQLQVIRGMTTVEQVSETE